MSAAKKHEDLPELVAVTDIKHGEPDGEVITVERGATIDRSEWDEDALVALYAGGSLTYAGSPTDPNLLDAPKGPFNTTPALVERALQVQADHAKAGLPLPQGAHTQAGLNEPPENPQELLEGVNETSAAPVKAPSSAGVPASVAEGAVKQSMANATEKNEAESEGEKE
jgi:hypothetical protein